MTQIATHLFTYQAPLSTAAITLTAAKAQALSASLSANAIWHGVDPMPGTEAIVFFKAEATQQVESVLNSLSATSAGADLPKQLFADAIGTIDELSFQIEQMKGLFPDEDGTIAAALENAEETAAALRAASR